MGGEWEVEVGRECGWMRRSGLVLMAREMERRKASAGGMERDREMEGEWAGWWVRGGEGWAWRVGRGVAVWR